MFLSRSRMPLLEVALLAEGVDRNRKKAFANDIEMEVALLAEGVDRNTTILQAHCQVHRSPSSRRAWIEILVMVNETRNAVRRPPRGGRG